MRRLGLLILAVVLVSCPARAAGVWSSDKSARIETIVTRYLAGRDGPASMALSVGVGIDGVPQVAKGWGEARPGVKADADTLYHIGSLTKQFTAAAILTLIDRDAHQSSGVAPLTLDRPLRELFDGASSWETPGAPPLTVRSLLTMTSSLPNFTKEPPPGSDPWGAMPADRLLSEVKKLAPVSWPNSFVYSNTSYFLLSEILEMRAGDRAAAGGYRAFLREHIFAPAGMTRTRFVGEGDASEVAVPNYQRHVGFGQPDWFKGSGDVVSSVADLLAWEKLLMEGRGGISRRTRDLMFRPWTPISPTLSYGMGFYVERAPGLKIFSHSGTVPGFTAFSAILTEQGKPGWISVTVLANSDGVNDLAKLADDLAVVALE